MDKTWSKYIQTPPYLYIYIIIYIYKHTSDTGQKPILCVCVCFFWGKRGGILVDYLLLLMMKHIWKGPGLIDFLKGLGLDHIRPRLAHKITSFQNWAQFVWGGVFRMPSSHLWMDPPAVAMRSTLTFWIDISQFNSYSIFFFLCFFFMYWLVVFFFFSILWPSELCHWLNHVCVTASAQVHIPGRFPGWPLVGHGFRTRNLHLESSGDLVVQLRSSYESLGCEDVDLDMLVDSFANLWDEMNPDLSIFFGSETTSCCTNYQLVKYQLT